MNTILKIVGYRHDRLSTQTLKIISDSNLRGDNMTLDDLQEYIKISMSKFNALYINSRMDVLDDKLFVMEDGKRVSFIIERTKL